MYRRRGLGHRSSYLVYGPLANGATTVMFEGVPNYPAVRMSQVVDKHQVTILYTAPTAIRALMAKGKEAVEGTSRTSLRIMGSVGEPINPEAWGGTTAPSATSAAPSSTPGGRPRPAASSSPAARRHRAQARLGHPSLLRSTACSGGQPG